MEATDLTLDEKESRLRGILGAIPGVALVAFSGGADSALLLAVAHRVLGPRCVAVTADSPSLPREELSAARAFASRYAIEHRLVRTGEMENPRFVRNDADRCFHCKGALFEAMSAVSGEAGGGAMLFGAITDDMGDWRPGMEAARVAGARAPLLEAGFTKADVRALSRKLGLPTWDKPAAACLSSRFPTGRPITLDDLARVERAEAALHGEGFPQCRVRLLGDSARVEVPEERLGELLREPLRSRIIGEMKALGFRFVTLDLEGFRSGSLNPSTERTHGIRRDT